jgi:hypothetical protein
MKKVKMGKAKVRDAGVEYLAGSLTESVTVDSRLFPGVSVMIKTWKSSVSENIHDVSAHIKVSGNWYTLSVNPHTGKAVMKQNPVGC